MQDIVRVSHLKEAGEKIRFLKDGINKMIIMKRILKITGMIGIICVLFTTVTIIIHYKNVTTDTADPIYSGRFGTDDTPILVAGSATIYWPEFHFWLNYIKKYYKKYNKIDEITDWNVTQNGKSLREYFLSSAVDYTCKNRAIEAKAEEFGIKLSGVNLKEMEKNRKDNIKIYGTWEYLRIVRRMYMSEQVYNYLMKIEYLSKQMLEFLYGENSERCSDEDIFAYVREKGFMCAKYIFLTDTDSSGNKLTPDKLSGKRIILNDILSRLNAIENPQSTFNTLIAKYSDDKSIAGYNDGRLFVPGSMDNEFENACIKLKENEFSGIVKTENGYYVIMRMPVFPDMKADLSGITLRNLAANDYLFKKQVEEWCAGMIIEYEDAYYNIDVENEIILGN